MKIALLLLLAACGDNLAAEISPDAFEGCRPTPVRQMDCDRVYPVLHGQAMTCIGVDDLEWARANGDTWSCFTTADLMCCVAR